MCSSSGIPNLEQSNGMVSPETWVRVPGIYMFFTSTEVLSVGGQPCE